MSRPRAVCPGLGPPSGAHAGRRCTGGAGRAPRGWQAAVPRPRSLLSQRRSGRAVQLNLHACPAVPGCCWLAGCCQCRAGPPRLPQARASQMRGHYPNRCCECTPRTSVRQARVQNNRGRPRRRQTGAATSSASCEAAPGRVQPSTAFAGNCQRLKFSAAGRREGARKLCGLRRGQGTSRPGTCTAATNTANSVDWLEQTLHAGREWRRLGRFLPVRGNGSMTEQTKHTCG